MKSVFPVGSKNFHTDIAHMITLVPVKHGEQVGIRVLQEFMIAAAVQLEMDWWGGFRERAAVLFGIVHACLVQRRKGEEMEEKVGLAERLGEMVIGKTDDDIVGKLADALAEGLHVEI